MFAVMFAFLLISPSFGSGHVDQGSFSDVMTTFAATAPIAVAVGLGMIAGQFDLSCVATFALGGMLAVKFGAARPSSGWSSPPAPASSPPASRARSSPSCA